MYTSNQSTQRSNLVVVENKSPIIEREIDQYVKSIRSLIGRVSPTERQKYYNGLLAFILNEQIELSDEKQNEAIDKSDYNKLSEKELHLLEELSNKMQQLYNTIGQDTE